MPELTLPGKLEWLITKKKRYKIIIGGRGSAKSQSVADCCIKDSQIEGLKIGCFREFQSSIEDSVHALLKSEIHRMECSGFTTLDTKIFNSAGGEFKFRGLSRNPDAMKSMHGFRRFWVEEAQTISKDSLQLLTPTLREEDSEIWMTANPMSSADPFSERFINPFQRELDRDGYYEDEMHLIIVSNYMDNPFFPQVLEEERLFDKENLSTAEYEHIWEGKFNDTVEGSIIPVEWFNSCINAHLVLGFKQLGATIVTHDPSDETASGKNDPAGLCVRHGSVVIDIQEKTTGDVNEKADWATYWAHEFQADVFRWDCDGLGAGLKRQISTALDGMRVDIDMFKGSESPDNPTDIYQPTAQIDKSNAKTNEQTFRNKRAQYYWYLRDRIYNTHLAVTRKEYRDPETLISFSSEIDCMQRLRSEVCRIPKKYNANGLIQIMNKQEMKKLKPPVASPNLADSLMMSMKAHTRNLAFQHTSRHIVTKTAAGWT
ncbi:MAG TPA: PBSX family phage terminase large subunit [Gammaproteobacteria bacterium]|nr:PBSX family phage terminase large subunit [Gammaproteobacteria bacterium]